MVYRFILVNAIFQLLAMPFGHAATKVDGVVIISQAAALSGGVTPGDSPGFPITISRSGSYRLASNLTVDAGNAIEIEVDDVSLDLNGFHIVGPLQCLPPHAVVCEGGPFDTVGISAHGRREVVVDSGSVRGFGTGVRVGEKGRVERLTVSHSPGYGILTDKDSLVSRNTIQLVGDAAIWTGGFGHVTSNVIGRVRTYGVFTMGMTIVSGNLIHDVGSYGVHGSAALSGNVFSAYGLGPFRFSTQLGSNMCGTGPC